MFQRWLTLFLLFHSATPLMFRPIPLSIIRFRGIGRSFSSISSSSASGMMRMSMSSVAGTEINDGLTKPKARKILSGIQPTGSIHLGNYLGSLSLWPALQVPTNTCNFCIVDLHSLSALPDATRRSTASELTEMTLMTAALYIACGIDPELPNVNVFVQSHIGGVHCELTWLLSCVCPVGWLDRMIQFKEKSAAASIESSDEDIANGGNNNKIQTALYTYPILMSSDILLYQTTHVPVGSDQKQHIELTRDLAKRFNELYCKGEGYKKRCKEGGFEGRVFREVDGVIMDDGSERIMSLTDGNKKMSKSDPSPNSRIDLLDSAEVVENKIKRCKTDDVQGIFWGEGRAECNNLLNVYMALTGKSKQDVTREVEHMQWSDFKPLLTKTVVAHLTPIQERYYEIRRKDGGKFLERILEKGAVNAEVEAKRTMGHVKCAMGFVPRF